MRFGLMYLFGEFGNFSQAQAFKDFLTEVELAEELGFDAVWLPEHHFSVYGMLGDTLTLAAGKSRRRTTLPSRRRIAVADGDAIRPDVARAFSRIARGRSRVPPRRMGRAPAGR